ncbi:MAG TPA: FHA domain-containing protein [Vicinamibacterales bacterium]
MDFLRKARALEARLTGTLDRTVGGLVKSGARGPLEIVHAIGEAAQEEVQSSGRGRRVFPFNTIALTILAPSRDARARLEAVFADGAPLRDRIAAQLRAAGCEIDDLDVTVAYDSKPRKGWRSDEFHIEFSRVAKPEPPPKDSQPEPALPRVELTVLNGTAERRSYALPASMRIDLGRSVEVRDTRHRLIRTNHIAFLERSGDVNQTVSRRHAHISYEPASKSFRLHDDGSEHGTGIVRQGRSLPVPRGARGVRLQSADEIVLGDARLRVKLT